MRYPGDLEIKKKLSVVEGGDDCCKKMVDDCADMKKYLDDEEEDDDEYEHLRNSTPPDGGFSWVIAFAAFFCLMVLEGMCLVYSLIGEEMQEFFGTSLSTNGWIGSSMAGTYYLAGPFAACLVARFGCKRTALAGSIITTCGLFLSTHSKTVAMMIVCYGVIGGFGLGLVYLPAVVAVGHWFDKKRAFAWGVAYLGSSVGLFLCPSLIGYLQQYFSWEGIILIMAGISANCCVAAMFFLPVDRWKAQKRRRRAINGSVDVVRGDIMKALIENKKRERCISNGSLDNAVITRDNRLIKLAPQFFEGKRNNSFIARVRRQLGFSSQSLASSKSSLQRGEVPSIVIEAVQKELSLKRAAAAVAASSGTNTATTTTTGSTSLGGSPIYKPSGVMTRSQHLRNSLSEKRGSTASFVGSNCSCSNSRHQLANNGSSAQSVSKTRSCDTIPSTGNLPSTYVGSNGVVTRSSAAAFSGPFKRSASDLGVQVPIPLPLSLSRAGMEGSELSIQSIQLIPNAHDRHRELAATRAKGIRHRSSRSESSTYSFGGFSYGGPLSSHVSSVLYGSDGTLPQIQASVEEVEYDLEEEEHTFITKCLGVFIKMLNYQPLFNLKFFLFTMSTVIIFMAMYIPFFFLPKKAIEAGLPEHHGRFLLVILGVSNMMGRLAVGWLADRPWVNTLYLYATSLVAGGLVMLFAPFCETSTTLGMMSSFIGLGMAIHIVLRATLLVEFFGLDQLTESFGLLSLFQGLAVLVGAPVAGWIMEVTENVNHTFFLAGALTMFAGLLVFPIKCLQERDLQKVIDSDVCCDDVCCGVQGQPRISETLTMEKLEGRPPLSAVTMMETSKV